jgi:Thiol:disulfide interchange protein DsbD, N-terminal
MKNLHRFLIAITVAGFVVFLGVARPQGQSVDANARVSFEPIDTVHVAMGKSTPVVFTFHIKPGFHVNSHQPTEPELIPTELKFSPPEDLVIAKVQYPAGVLTSFPFDPATKLSVYSGDVTVKATVLTAPKTTAGNHTVHGELKYQACDNNSCYPPKKLPIQFDVDVTASKNHKRPTTIGSPESKHP